MTGRPNPTVHYAQVGSGADGGAYRAIEQTQGSALFSDDTPKLYDMVPTLETNVTSGEDSVDGYPGWWKLDRGLDNVRFMNRWNLFALKNDQQNSINPDFIGFTPNYFLSHPGQAAGGVLSRGQRSINENSVIGFENEMIKQHGFFFNYAFFPVKQTISLIAGNGETTIMGTRMKSYCVFYSSFPLSKGDTSRAVHEGNTPMAPLLFHNPHYEKVYLVEPKATTQPGDVTYVQTDQDHVMVDVSLVGDENCQLSIQAAIQNCGMRRGAYLTLIPILSDMTAEDPQNGFYERPNLYFINGASLGLACCAAIMGAPPAHYTGFIGHPIPYTVWDPRQSERQAIWEGQGSTGDNMMIPTDNGDINGGVVVDQNVEGVQQRFTIEGLSRSVGQKNLVESVGDLMIKITYCLMNNICLIMPNITGTGENMLSWYYKRLASPQQAWLQMLGDIYTMVDAADQRPYFFGNPQNANDRKMHLLYSATTLTEAVCLSSYVAYGNYHRVRAAINDSQTNREFYQQIMSGYMNDKVMGSGKQAVAQELKDEIRRVTKDKNMAPDEKMAAFNALRAKYFDANQEINRRQDQNKQVRMARRDQYDDSRANLRDEIDALKDTIRHSLLQTKAGIRPKKPIKDQRKASRIQLEKITPMDAQKRKAQALKKTDITGLAQRRRVVADARIQENKKAASERMKRRNAAKSSGGATRVNQDSAAGAKSSPIRAAKSSAPPRTAAQSQAPPRTAAPTRGPSLANPFNVNEKSAFVTED